MSAGAPLGRTSSPLLPELVIGSSARYVDEVSRSPPSIRLIGAS